MTLVKKCLVALISLTLTLAGAQAASASSLQIRLSSFGVSNQVTDGSITFSVDFSGGPADTAASCAALMADIGDKVTFDFTVSGQVDSEPSAYFDVTNAGITGTSLSCVFKSNLLVAHMDSTVESIPTTFALSWSGSPVISHSGVILNPSYQGNVTISSPTRGAVLQGWSPLSYQIDAGAGRAVSAISISLCSIKCYNGATYAQVYPNLEYNDGTAGDGFVSRGTLTGVNVFFTTTGLYEVRVRAQMGEVVTNQSVFVNVASAMKDTPIPTDVALNLINSASQSVGLNSKLNCGSATLVAGASRTCEFTTVGDSRYREEGAVMTTVSGSVFTSLNGGPFTPALRFQATTGVPVTFKVPVGKNVKTFVVRTYIDGYVATEGYYRASYQEASWGPAPTSISINAPSLVRWGAPLKISITSNKKLNGTCKVALNNSNVITSFKLLSGKGSGVAKLVWGGGVGSSVSLPLFAYCSVGGVAATSFIAITGVR
jgi:hypothetical protein